MEKEDDIRKSLFPTTQAFSDSLLHALEGNGLEDTSWDFLPMTGNFFSGYVARSFVKKVFLKRIIDGRRLYKKLISNLRRIKRGKKILDEAKSYLDEFKKDIERAEAIYSFWEQVFSDLPVRGDSITTEKKDPLCEPDATRIIISPDDLSSSQSIGDATYPSIGAGTDTKTIRLPIPDFKFIEEMEYLNEQLEQYYYNYNPERPFNPRLKNDIRLYPVDTDSIIPVQPPEEDEPISGSPLDSFSLTARSMARAQSAAAQGLASLNFSLLEQSQPAGATVAGQFASLGSRTVEDMGYQPAGLASLRQLTDQATATLQAMHPDGAAAAGAGLLALSCLLRGRIGGGKNGASAEASGGGSTGVDATQSPKRPMNVYVEGRRMSSPAELERTLARSGMHPALRTAYVNLMRYDSVLS